MESALARFVALQLSRLGSHRSFFSRGRRSPTIIARSALPDLGQIFGLAIAVAAANTRFVGWAGRP